MGVKPWAIRASITALSDLVMVIFLVRVAVKVMVILEMFTRMSNTAK